MKLHHSLTCPGAMLLPVALAITACSYPNETVTEAAAEVTEPFTSGEILQVVHILNSGEIMQAEWALHHSSSPAIQETAQLIIDDHTTSNKHITDLVQDTGIALEESALSNGLQLQMEEIKEELAGLPGAEFNCTYLKKQVEQHTLALEIARNELLPDAENPQVREILTTAEPKLEHHREVARESRADLSCPSDY